MDDVRDLLERLIEKHLTTLRAISAAIRAQAVAMRRGGESGREAAKSAHSLAHQIAGAAGSIGFAEVSVAGRALEHQLRPLAESGATPDSEEVEVIRALIDRLEAVVMAQRPDTSSLYGRDLSLLRPGGRKEA